MNLKKIIIIVCSVLVALVIAALIIYKTMFISKSEVKEIVVEHASIKMEDAKKWSIDFEYEDGMFIYSVDVIFNNQEYEYEINAKTGEVILYKLDK